MQMEGDLNQRLLPPSDDSEKMTIYPVNRVNPVNREMGRNLIAFWIIGLCNNFGYVVMLSAAFDILKAKKEESHPKLNTSFHLPYTNHNVTISNKTGFHCNPTSTGLILIADILPSIIMKMSAPFYIQKINYHVRFVIVISTLALSLIILALSSFVLLSIFAVVLASISAGLGEITFVSLTSHFKRSTVSAWSSGTGLSGVTGSVAYAGLLQLGLSSKDALLILLVVPSIFTLTVWRVLKFPSTVQNSISLRNEIKPSELIPDETSISEDRTKNMSFKMKLQLIFALRKYMIPLFLVYLAEYSINQGLYEFLYYDVPWLTQAQQYRWFQVDYQVAVFLSRSSVYLFHIRKVMLLSMAQCVLFGIFLLEVCYPFIHYIWITLGLIFVEGLIGGAVYVNTFFRITEEIEPDIREFSLGATTSGDSFGVGLAGVVAIPLHNILCKLKKS